jgi:hypothetical protein
MDIRGFVPLLGFLSWRKRMSQRSACWRTNNQQARATVGDLDARFRYSGADELKWRTWLHVSCDVPVAITVVPRLAPLDKHTRLP